MTAWTTRADIRKAVDRLWSQGAVLRAAWPGVGLEFPHRIGLKGPSSTQWSERFDESRRWIAELDGLPLEWREFTHPTLGKNRVPVAVEWKDLRELAAFAGKAGETRRFVSLAEAITARVPALSSWAQAHPLRLLDLADDVDRLLGVVDWVAAHPRPGVYLRQIDVPGVHTKFVEARRGVLAEWLDLALPPEAIDPEARGVGRFAERFGFAVKPQFVRFRPLDPSLPGPRDLSWRLEDWTAWDPPPRRLVITENEINYLSLPPLPGAWAVFGAGYAFDGWKPAAWLAAAEVWYWGDLDTHGFAILDQLRAVVPHARSFLMDEATLLAHRGFWGREDSPADRALTRLTGDEQAVYQGLVHDKWGARLRLEQEHLSYQTVCRELETLIRLE